MASNDDDVEQLQAIIQNTSGVAVTTSSSSASKEAEQDDDGKRSFLKFYSCSNIVVPFSDGKKVCLTCGESFDAPHRFSTICTDCLAARPLSTGGRTEPSTSTSDVNEVVKEAETAGADHEVVPQMYS